MKGFIRRFWNKSGDHRGTPESNGLVAAMVDVRDLRGHRSEEDIVTGLIYEIPQNDIADVLTLLDRREKYGYIRSTTEAFCASDGSSLGECFVYIASFDPSIDVFLRPANGIDNSKLELENIARVISSASGPSGSNFEYLVNLRNALSLHSFIDWHVEQVYELCIKRNSRNYS